MGNSSSSKANKTEALVVTPTKVYTPPKDLPVYTADAVAKQSEKLLEEADNNPDKALANGIKEVTDRMMETAKKANNYVMTSSKAAEVFKDAGDKAVFRNALNLAKTQRKLSKSTMKLCSKIATKGVSWKRFYLAMAQGVRKLKADKKAECLEILEAQAVKNFPEIDEIVADLVAIHDKWEELSNKLLEVAGHINKIKEKYKKKQEECKKQAKGDFWKLCACATVGTIAIGGVVALGIIAAPFAAPAGLVGAGALAATGVLGSSVLALMSQSKKHGETADLMESQSACILAMADMAKQTQEGLANAHKNIKTNVMFFCQTLEHILTHKIQKVNSGSLGIDKKNPSASELCKALQWLIDQEEDTKEDALVVIKQAIDACMELEVTLLCLKTSLMTLNADGNVNEHIKSLYFNSEYTELVENTV